MDRGFEIEHVRDKVGLLQANWTLGDLGVGSEPPEGFDVPQLFELLLWPALRKDIDRRDGRIDTGDPLITVGTTLTQGESVLGDPLLRWQAAASGAAAKGSTRR